MVDLVNMNGFMFPVAWWLAQKFSPGVGPELFHYFLKWKSIEVTISIMTTERLKSGTEYNRVDYSIRNLY